MKPCPIFNPFGNDAIQNRSIWKGETTNLMQLNEVRYSWAIALYNQMRSQFWVPQKTDLTKDITDYTELSTEEVTAFEGILSYLAFLDSIQTCNLPHMRLYVSAPEINLCLSEQISQECFDDETEILTNQGWKLFKDLKDEDLVAQYKLDTEIVTFVKPIKRQKYEYSGNLIAFKSNQTSIRVTPNHELINIHPVTKHKTKRFAANTKGGSYSYPKTGTFESTNNLVSLESKLLIAIATDGIVRSSSETTNVQMHLTTSRKQKRLEKLLNDLKINFKKTVVHGTLSEYSFISPVVIEQAELESLSFVNIAELSQSAAIELVEELCFWNESNNKVYYSDNTKAVDKAQLIGTVAGKCATVSVDVTTEEAAKRILSEGGIATKTKTRYAVSYSNSRYETYPNPIEEYYEGYVYCVTVPTGNIVTRRDKKIAITGNSMHSASYQYIIETIIPSERRNQVYDFWRTDKVLLKRCDFIASLFQNNLDNPTEENYFIALLGDYILEGLYFYTGFNFFYNLSFRKKMSGCADIFRLINKDELSHVRLFQSLVKEAMRVFPYKEELIYSLFDRAVKQEIEWTNHIIGNSILGITEESTNNYVKYLANLRLRAIGMEPLYYDKKYNKNPYKHLERLSDTTSEGNTKANFFESGVTSYNQSSAISGWSDF